ncbi:hypothetical protein V5J35_001815 [Endozoicomonas sp. NE40]|uniref:Uncharacterized protein n=1 Tax=Endozoicomonas lisbonensis TaxID=3120522 RepID=A0ABV2SFT2_9GAMM
MSQEKGERYFEMFKSWEATMILLTSFLTFSG